MQITILQSSYSKHEQFKKNPLYTCTLHCQILDLSTNKTHQDTQTRTHTITALVCVYTNQIRIEAKIQCTIHKLEKKILINLLH